MYGDILEKVKRIKPSALGDSDIIGFLEEAVTLCCDDKNDYAGGTYMDHVLLYYALAHVALYSGDLAEYSNYFMLYNNAASEFKRRNFGRPDDGGTTAEYHGMW